MRTPLPNRRKAITSKVKAQNRSVFIGVGLTADNKLGELFIDASKCGSTLQSVFASWATLISVQLQMEVTWADIMASQKDFIYSDASGIMLAVFTEVSAIEADLQFEANEAEVRGNRT